MRFKNYLYRNKLNNTYLILTVCILLRFPVLYAQETFNRSYDLGLPAVVFTDVLVEDSSLFIAAPIYDTLYPNLASSIIELDFLGNVINHSVVQDTVYRMDFWTNSLQRYEDSLFIYAAELYDGTGKADLIIFNKKGKIKKKIEQLNPAYPNADFIIADDLIKGYNGNYILLSHYDAGDDFHSDIITAFIDSSLTKVDSIQIEKVKDFSEYQKVIEKGNNKDYFIGISKHNLPLVEKNFTFQNIIKRLDSNYQEIWVYETPEDSLLGICFALCPTQDGGVVVGTNTGIELFQNPSSNLYGNKNGFVYKLNNSGELLWEKILYQDEGFNEIRDIIELENGEIVFVGHTAENLKEYDFVDGWWNRLGWLTKLSSEGDSIWSRYYSFYQSTSDFHTLYDFELMPDNGFVMCGEVHPGSQQGWLLRVDSLGCLVPGCHQREEAVDSGDYMVGTDEIALKPYIKIAPNPATQFLNVYFRSDPKIKDGEFRIYDIRGKEIMKWRNSLEDVTHIIPVHELVSGTYILAYYTEGKKVYSGKWVKE